MKSQTYSKTFLAAVLVLALWMASGCANKNNVAEDGEQTEAFSDASGSESLDGEPTAPEEPTAQEAELFGEGEQKEATTEVAKTDGTEAADPAMESLFDAAPQDAAAEPNFEELTGKSTEQAPAETAPNSADPLLAEKAAEPAVESVAANTPDFSPSVAKSYSGAVAPNIPERAVVRKGKSLNRYYFVRSGDNTSKVSELIYGDTTHAADLKKWNKGRWSPGKVVYYASPSQPDDAQMVSFYDERNLTPDQHTVARGESMSAIAKNLLGSTSSWKELAVVNGLSSPDTLQKGQTIKVFSSLTSSNAVAETPVTEPVVASAPSETKPSVAPEVPPIPADMGALAPGTQDPVAEDLNKTKRKPKKDGLNLAKVLSQNSFTIAMGLGLGLLLVSLMMINKRKRGGGAVEEFGEDAFAAPNKKKRR